MVRLVYIGEQITQGNNDFAWYDTITDEFISFAGQVVFDSWGDFEESYTITAFPHSPIERFKTLFPTAGTWKGTHV